MGARGRGFYDTETAAGRYPLSSISIEVLPFGFDRSTVNRFCSVRRGSRRNPKTSRETERQRTNNNEDGYATPVALPEPAMYPQWHCCSQRWAYLSDYTVSNTMAPACRQQAKSLNFDVLRCAGCGIVVPLDEPTRCDAGTAAPSWHLRIPARPGWTLAQSD
jgi:hypothetical protein